uniref:TBC1 domain family member 31 n=1 Tax=Scophthalmus maximus TaxID=52904 RepID=A0A8D3E2P5_SCOMX
MENRTEEVPLEADLSTGADSAMDLDLMGKASDPPTAPDKPAAEPPDLSKPQRRQQGGYECKYCPFSTQNLNKFKEHVDANHPNVILNPLYLCAVCNFNTKKFDTLTEHNERCHPGESNFKFKRIKMNNQTILEQTIDGCSNNAVIYNASGVGSGKGDELGKTVKVGKPKIMSSDNKRTESQLGKLTHDLAKKPITAVNTSSCFLGRIVLIIQLPLPTVLFQVPKIAVPLNTTKYNPSLDDNLTLISSFNKFPYPTQAELSWLTAASKHPEEQIKVWFTTQRLKQGISWSPEEVEEARKKMFNGTISSVPQTFTLVAPQLSSQSSANMSAASKHMQSAASVLQSLPCQLLGQSSLVLTPVANGSTVTCAPMTLTLANQSLKRPLTSPVIASESKRPSIIQTISAPMATSKLTSSKVLNFTVDPNKTAEQLSVLRSSYSQCPFPEEDEIYRLIETTGLSRGEIKKWFSEQRLLNVKGTGCDQCHTSKMMNPPHFDLSHFPLLERVKGKTSEQLKALEESFQRSSSPTEAELSKTEVDCWFSERRALRDNMEKTLLTMASKNTEDRHDRAGALLNGAPHREQDGRPLRSSPHPPVLSSSSSSSSPPTFCRTQWPCPEEYSQLEVQTSLGRTDIVRWFKDHRLVLKNGETLDWMEGFQKQNSAEQTKVPSEGKAVTGTLWRMEVTDIGNKEEGKVWHRKPTAGKGVLVTVARTAQQGKTVRFLHVAFDTTGDSFLAGDHHGNIYVFDISRNRFRLVQKTGQACTALAFTLRRTTEFLVALADYTVKCFDKDTKQLVSWMRGHEGAVSSVSVHSSGRYAVTTSSDTAQLWDLDTFQRKRKLNIRQSVGIQRVFFLPHSNTILSCFSDDSIFAWESDTLFCKYQLPVPDCGPKVSYKAFAVTRDGKRLVAGGRSNLLHMWCLDSQELVRVIQMPTQVRTVRQLEFLPDSFDGGASQTLGVLSQDGVMRFIHIHTCKLLFHMGSHDGAITTVAVSPNGRHVVAIMDNGSINIYNVQCLTQELNKPPPSRVAVVSDGDQELSNLKVRVRSEVVQRPAMSLARKQVKVLRPPAVSTADDKENELPAGLNKKRLVALLKTFGEFPAKYRMFVWRSLLCLPENHAAYSSLTDKGLHSAYLTLHNRYPIKSLKLQRGLQRVLSALGHWAAIFGEVEYLPLVAFPFVKLFQNNPILCFEVVATVIVNWCQHWFEYFPNPPLNILNMAENVLAHHDKELLQHLVDCGITSQLYVWPLLETLFSEVLTCDEWLRLFDNIFSNHPSFLIITCVAYITCCREPLLLCSQKQDFEYFFHHRNNLDVGAMIKEAYRLLSCTPADIHPRTLLSDFTPLTKGQYPVFNHYPEFIVEYQSQEREKIRLQEKEYLRERQEVSALRADFVRRNAEEETYYTQQELLQKAEEQRRKILAQEEEKLSQQRTKLTAMKRELKVKEIQLLDASRRRFLKHQQDLRASQIQRLDQEIGRKMDLRERETAAAVEDLEVRQMELEAQRKRLEQVFEFFSDHNFSLQHSLEESLADACQLGLESDWQRDVAERLQRVDAEQERKRERLAALHRQTLAEEERLADTMRDVAGRKVRTTRVCLSTHQFTY